MARAEGRIDMGTASATPDIGAALSFEEFFAAESEKLFRRMWLATGNRAESEEITQDAFLALWERWDRVATLDDPTGYLNRTAMNLFRKRYRRAVARRARAGRRHRVRDRAGHRAASRVPGRV